MQSNKKPASKRIPARKLVWRSGWDSNPREIALKLISSQPRYDRFDTAACNAYLFVLPIIPDRRRKIKAADAASCAQPSAARYSPIL